ncbi:kinase-like domain-containing protein [Rhizophagus irregularis DAOM 181602=DAOM 197198]|nr:kinase-like domain-containing protein [Rhizophagus irregularis DAOM 181602=DAOM 197198]
MDQQFEEEENQKCVQCKQEDTDFLYCETCREHKHKRCTECLQVYTGRKWCQSCNSKRFQQNFDNWTSGNKEIDKFIQDTQLSAKYHFQIFEWMPYDNFYNVVYIGEGGFGKVHKANWKDGYIVHWDTSKNQWERHGRKNNFFVALKSLNNSQNVTLEFINEITFYIRTRSIFYGITQDPNTKDYVLIMSYAKENWFRNPELSKMNLDWSLQMWRRKIDTLQCIATGLRKIHSKELIHRNLHIGNVLRYKNVFCLSDVGFCKPANYKELENENNMYGVLSSLAPEILRGQNYTKASDIYSLGVVMYVVISTTLPYCDVAHDENLALKICEGLRPRFNIKLPRLILHLIKRCLDANPLNRPEPIEIITTLHGWSLGFKNYFRCEEKKTELIKTELIEQIEEMNSSPLPDNSSLTNTMHPEAIYKSRPFNFKNLPEPKNSDDYYETFDDISNMKYSEG